MKQTPYTKKGPGEIRLGKQTTTKQESKNEKQNSKPDADGIRTVPAQPGAANASQF